MHMYTYIYIYIFKYIHSFLGQQANKKETQFGHHSRVDRFIPLKKKKDVAYASGLEAGLLQGSEGVVNLVV